MPAEAEAAAAAAAAAWSSAEEDGSGTSGESGWPESAAPLCEPDL